MRTCSRCGATYRGELAEAFFRRTTRHYRSIVNSAVCIGCELTSRTEAKERNRALEKARRTFYHHADKYIRDGGVESRAGFAERFGWELNQMAHDIEHASQNGCPYCHRLFRLMPNGLRNVTLDIVDPDQPPYYQTNTRWVCGTCNSEKQRTDRRLWGAKLVAWRLWRERQRELELRPPPKQLALDL